MTDPLRTRPDPTAVPDRFRDQLAALAEEVADYTMDTEDDDLAAWLLTVATRIRAAARDAAEVARVQAAANQRAAEELRAAADTMRRFAGLPGVPSEVAHTLIVLLVGIDARADALTQPADGTGQP
jgi:hypothetical protein